MEEWEERQKERIEAVDKQRRKLDDHAFNKQWDNEKARRRNYCNI